MRRMIHNTTAIVTCLSLLVPSVALAQAPAAEEDIKKLEEQLSQAAEDGPQAVEEQTAPITPPLETPAAEAPAAAEEAPAAAEPEAAPAEEPAAEQAPVAAEVAPTPDAVTEGTPEPEAVPVPPVAEEAPVAAEPEAVAEEAPATAVEEEPAAEVAPEAAAPAETAPAETVPTETAPAETVPTETAPAETAPPASAPVAEEEAMPEAAEETPAAEAESTTAAPATESTAAPATGTTDPTAATPTEPTATEPDAAATTPKAEAPAPVTEKTPAADAASTTPAAPPAAQTEASKEAASGAPAAAVSALDDTATGEVVSQEVTKADARSSDEDFATSLKEALNQQAPQEASNDDDKNNLGKALLLGLGGVAVGAMLANNRQVELSSPDRVVVTRPDGSQEIIKDEVALLRQPGSTVSTENFDDGSSRTIVTREDGSQVVTIRDADLRILRRSIVTPDGQSTALIDDTRVAEPVDIATLPAAAAPITGSLDDEDALREALMNEAAIDRSFTLGQIRNISEVRSLVAPVNIDAITFETGSAAISPDQAKQLSSLGNVIQQTIVDNPQELFLIEGHTDAVGSNAMNLALSDRRAESVALALSEYFKVPAENLVVQGYGEQFPKVQSDGDVRENRRAAVRRITELMQKSN